MLLCKNKMSFGLQLNYLQFQFIFLSHINFRNKQAVHKPKSQGAEFQEEERTKETKKEIFQFKLGLRR